MILIGGCYKIVNKITGEFYIGSSSNISNRFKKHKLALDNNRHINKHLQNSYNKHGKDSFDFEIIIKTEDKDLLIFEQYYIDTLKPSYNKAPVAGSTLGIKHSDEFKEKKRLNSLGKKHSEETKLKMSASHIGKVRSEEHKRNNSISKANPIIMLDLSNKVIKEFWGIREAIEYLNLSKWCYSPIRECLVGNKLHVYGYKWVYKNGKSKYSK